MIAEQEEKKHKAGFVNIIGSPNVGKSTLMNALIGQKMSIISPKAQTTRHRIFGLLNGEDFQIVYSDTPGILSSSYKLHDVMMQAVKTSLEDADVFLFLTDIYEKQNFHPEIIQKINTSNVPILLLINKIDLLKNKDFLDKMVEFWNKEIPNAEILPISALKRENTEWVLKKILSWLPEHPAYFDKDQLSDRNMRFFVSEIIREKIFLNYEKEVPYCSEVIVEEYIQGQKVLEILATIIVSRETQKAIILGHRGEKIKKLGIDARKDIEEFTRQNIFLKLFVKVDSDWRDDDYKLKKYGYIL